MKKLAGGTQDCKHYRSKRSETADPLDNLVAGVPAIRASDYSVGMSAFGGKADTTFGGPAFVVAIRA